MLRFGQRPAAPTRRIVGPPVRGVWMLLLMLGAVIMLMRQLQQPAAVDFLGQVFAPDAADGDIAVDRRLEDNAIGEPSQDPAATVSAATAASQRVPLDEAVWSKVKDNTIFMAVEQPAWLLLLAEAQRSSTAELSRAAGAEVAYAQLVNQPDVYRGRAVRVRGQVLREVVKKAPLNSLGITEYHQLWLAPRGGGEWPIVVYALNLPPGFPAGGELKEPVTVDGLFFKNWSYPYDSGMGLAPIVVTPTINWQPPIVAPAAPALAPSDWTRLVIGGVLAAGVAGAFVAWAVRQTRRPRSELEPLPDLASLESES